jgi:hypothetical protein
MRHVPVEAEVRVYRGRQELFRQTETFTGEQITVNVTSKIRPWTGMMSRWPGRWRQPGRFYAKSHLDWGAGIFGRDTVHHDSLVNGMRR